MPRIRPPVPSSRSLPANVADLEAQRVVKRSLNLLDEVEQVYLALYDNTTFRAYREALEPDDCVEGSIQMDDACAAQMIRKKADEMGHTLAATADLTQVSLKLRAAERRVNASRKQRSKAAPTAQQA